MKQPYTGTISGRDGMTVCGCVADSEGIEYCSLHNARKRFSDVIDAGDRLHDILSDCIESGRLTRGHLPEDYEALVDALVKRNFAKDQVKQ